jgi:SAM-dependent methyltransferase
MNERDIRSEVSVAYAKALQRSREGKGGCCGSGGCCGAGGSRLTTSLAGYGAQEAAHAEAASSSFGCGNPLAFAGVEPGQTVLDLGSGAGLDLLIASDKVGPGGRVIGVDMTEDMLEAARENARKAGRANIELRRGFIEELPVADASVDWVISNCVINLSPDKPRVFAEIFRVLKPGGRFSISDVVAEDLPGWLRESAAAYAACVAGAISEEKYLRGLAEAGLTDVRVVERIHYDRAQLAALVGDDAAELPLPPDLRERGLDAAAGKVWSAKFEGRRPQ